MSPTTAIDETHMRVLEKAIEGFEEVKFKYRAQKAKSAVLRQVRPLGLLYLDASRIWWLLQAIVRRFHIA